MEEYNLVNFSKNPKQETNMANAVGFPDLDTAVSDFFQKGSPITFETKDLYLRPTEKTDQPFFERLFTSYETMEPYAENRGRYEKLGETV